MIVIYTFQWNYFNAKGMFGTRREQIRLKDRSREETHSTFSLELLYVFTAMFTLLLNVSALFGFTEVASALLISFFEGALFFVLVFREFSSSIVHLRNRHYAKPLWPPARLRPDVRWWQLSQRWQLRLLRERAGRLPLNDAREPEVSYPALWSALNLLSSVLSHFVRRVATASRRIYMLILRFR